MDVLPASYTNGSGWGTINRGVAAWANRMVFTAAQFRFQDSMKDLQSLRATLDNAWAFQSSAISYPS